MTSLSLEVLGGSFSWVRMEPFNLLRTNDGRDAVEIFGGYGFDVEIYAIVQGQSIKVVAPTLVKHNQRELQLK